MVGSVVPGDEWRAESSRRPRRVEPPRVIPDAFPERVCCRLAGGFARRPLAKVDRLLRKRITSCVARLAGGRSRLALSLADSVQKLVELPPTRSPRVAERDRHDGLLGSVRHTSLALAGVSHRIARRRRTPHDGKAVPNRTGPVPILFGTACGESRPLAPQADPENRLRSKRSTSGGSACGASVLHRADPLAEQAVSFGASGLLSHAWRRTPHDGKAVPNRTGPVLRRAEPVKGLIEDGPTPVDRAGRSCFAKLPDARAGGPSSHQQPEVAKEK
jgi:hypothetical protein